MDTDAAIAFLLGFGLVGAAVLAFLEKLIPIIPSYAMLILLGSSATDPGGLAAKLGATTLGSVAGALVWYGLGRALGSERIEALVERYGRYMFLKPDLYRRLAAAYRRNQFWATLAGQNIPGARVYLALPAGVLRLDFGPFLAATIIGVALWNGAFLATGYLLRGAGESQFTVVVLIVFALLGAELIAFLVVQRRNARRKAGLERKSGEAGRATID